MLFPEQKSSLIKQQPLLDIDYMSTALTFVRKIVKFLDQISDDGTFRIAKRRGGHQRLVALYRGQKRSFTVPRPGAGGPYPKRLQHDVNRFVSSLQLEKPPEFSF